MWVIPTIDFEKLYVRVLRNYVQVASSALKLDPPYTVELGAVGLQDVSWTPKMRQLAKVEPCP